MVLDYFCGFCTHKRLVFLGGFLNRHFISLNYDFCLRIGLLWRDEIPVGTDLHVFTMLSFTYPQGDISSAEAKIVYRNTSAVQKRYLSP